MIGGQPSGRTRVRVQKRELNSISPFKDCLIGKISGMYKADMVTSKRK